MYCLYNLLLGVLFYFTVAKNCLIEEQSVYNDMHVVHNIRTIVLRLVYFCIPVNNVSDTIRSVALSVVDKIEGFRG